MKKETYVIVNQENLCFMNEGYFTDLENAKYFSNLSDAKEELEKYDDKTNMAIYKMKEFIKREFEIVRE